MNLIKEIIKNSNIIFPYWTMTSSRVLKRSFHVKCQRRSFWLDHTCLQKQTKRIIINKIGETNTRLYTTNSHGGKTIYSKPTTHGFYLKLGLGLGILTPAVFFGFYNWKVRAKQKFENDNIQHDENPEIKEKPRTLSIVEFIPKDSTNQDNFIIKINTQAFLSVLDKIGDKNFIICSVNGSTRTGKSFILNYFLRHLKTDKRNWAELSLSEQFPWRSGTGRETVGINLWSEPFFIKTEQNNEEIAILLLDCQGLFDPQTSQKQNAIIFTLSNLLSSIMIYNVMGNLDESTLRQFEFHSDYAKLVTDSEQVDVGKLIILLRDYSLGNFSFGYHDNEHCPCPPSSSSSSSSQQNYFKWFMEDIKLNKENKYLRDKIKQNYKNIGFFLMPHPGNHFIETSSPSFLDPTFRKHVKAFVENTFENIDHFIKTISGAKITGNEFKNYILKWSNLFENSKPGELPEVYSMLEATRKLQNESSLNMAIKYYKREFEDFIQKPKEDNSMKEMNDVLFGKSIKMFKNERKIGGHYNNKYDEEYIQILETELFIEFQRFFERNQLKRETGQWFYIKFWNGMINLTTSTIKHVVSVVTEYQLITFLINIVKTIISPIRGVIKCFERHFLKFWESNPKN